MTSRERPVIFRVSSATATAGLAPYDVVVSRLQVESPLIDKGESGAGCHVSGEDADGGHPLSVRPASGGQLSGPGPGATGA